MGRPIRECGEGLRAPGGAARSTRPLLQRQGPACSGTAGEIMDIYAHSVSIILLTVCMRSLPFPPLTAAAHVLLDGHRERHRGNRRAAQDHSPGPRLLGTTRLLFYILLRV